MPPPQTDRGIWSGNFNSLPSLQQPLQEHPWGALPLEMKLAGKEVPPTSTHLEIWCGNLRLAPQQPPDERPWSPATVKQEPIDTVLDDEANSTSREDSNSQINSQDRSDEVQARESQHCDGIHRCRFCPRIFHSETSATTHEKIHLGEPPFYCRFCHKEFKSKSSLNIHKRVHTGDKPFSCPVCNKTFADAAHLTIHKRSHNKERPYKCDLCGKGFLTGGNLKVHRRTHTGEKPFECRTCHRMFAQKSQCVVHERTHTGQKSFKCDLCGKAFTEKYTLKGHMRVHTGGVPVRVEDERTNGQLALSVRSRRRSAEWPRSRRRETRTGGLAVETGKSGLEVDQARQSVRLLVSRIPQFEGTHWKAISNPRSRSRRVSDTTERASGGVSSSGRSRCRSAVRVRRDDRPPRRPR
ncbi:zinc finger protein 239-like [Ixodes scapularis]